MTNFSKLGRALALLASGIAIFGASAPALADGLASLWVEGFNNKARLLAGRAAFSGKDSVYAAVEIVMPAGWKTYWRAPGDAGGIPPEFDFAASQNLAEARVLYPAPHRLFDKAGATIGYKDRVIFPVALTAKDPAQPVQLKLKAAYGVCKELCVPAEAEIEVAVPPDAAASAEIATALATVPVSAPVQGRDPAVSAWRVEDRAGKPVLVIEAIDPGGAGGDAFVYASTGGYMPLPKKTSETADKSVYEVDLTDGVDLKDLKDKPVLITLVGGKGQSETAIVLP